jgi:G3E family GTPase
MTGQRAIPVTLLTGFFGAGKIALLNRILTESRGKRYAVIVDEFGEVGIDNDLVVGADEEIFEMNNGCICCTVRGDLIRMIEGLMRRRNGLDGILIETTGLADPAPVAQTFFVDEDVRSNAKLDAIVTVADAKRLFGALDESHEAQEQIAFADVVLLNKTDLVFSGELEQVRGRIRAINPSAAIRETQRCEIELSELLGRDAFNLARVLAVEPDFLEGDHDHEHDDRVSSLSLTSERPLDPQKFMPWIQEITQVFGREILRMKGILAFPNDPDRFVVQGVHMLLEGDRQRAWRPGEARASRLVFIGRDLPKDALRAGFEKCIAVN